ncbi:MAG: response regulator, partial [Massilia sp.]|nr:response regulator [Massilia sp.]
MKYYSDTTSAGAGYSSLKRARILLVEDNVFNGQIALDMLEDAGAVVSLARNGHEALDLLARAQFDCVLMDIQMPVMDGLQATRLIRLDARLASLPVLAMTASASGEDRQRCMAAGMDDFIAKPIQPVLLCQVLARYLPRAVHGLAEASASGAGAGASIPAGDPRVIDLAILATLLSGDAAKVRKFALKFLQTTQSGFAEMETSLAAGNVQRVRELGHRI